MTDASGEVTFAARYTPWGSTLETYGTGNFEFGYFGGLMDEASGLLYIGNGQYYDPATGRFLNRDAKTNNSNPYVPFDPMGAMLGPLGVLALVLGSKKKKSTVDVLLFVLVFVVASGMMLSACNLPQGQFTATAIGVPNFPLAAMTVNFENGTTVKGVTPALPNGTPSIIPTICTPSVPENDGKQYDLTGYLALAMTKHGKDARVKDIANLIAWHIPTAIISPVVSSAMLATAYLKFYNLEASEKEWDIKVKIGDQRKGILGQAIILCGVGIQSCDWFDYSTVGNIHFGYIAGLAKIDYFISGVMGGLLEQRDLMRLEGKFNFGYCGWTSGIPLFCDNSNDQYAVDFGFHLAEKYPYGISEGQLENELTTYSFGGLLGMLQKPRIGSIPLGVPAMPQINQYGPDHFNYYGN